MSAAIRSSIACNLDANLLLAAIPLFESGKVQAIEWSFDTLFKHNQLPDWFEGLLRIFSEQNRLIGHGVFFSLFFGKWTKDQQTWLDQLKNLTTAYTFDHITEHFGFMTGSDFHTGAPLSIPFTRSTLALGRDRLQRIQQAGNCPVGLENLAFACSLEEVKRHGGFLDQLLESVNGFIILDLHNLYCHLQNFDIALSDLLALYPVERVREIHISGGSWHHSPSNPIKKIRRDTHDEPVPPEVFEMLAQTIDKCHNLKYVVLEQLGSSLHSEESRKLFQEDFFRMDCIVQEKNNHIRTTEYHSFLPPSPVHVNALPLEDLTLHAQQRALSVILETAPDYQQAKALLDVSILADSAWEIEKWEPHMLETAIAIARKWKGGFA